jgi:putative transport system permease protein
MFSGLIIGFIFGFLLTRSHFCPTGTIRDIALEGYIYNIALIFSLITTEGLIYYSLVILGLVPPPSFKYFPLFSVVLGAFIFGFGAVLTNGCITSSLVKLGDGRITGVISVLVFSLSVAATKQGALKPITQFLASRFLIKDELHKNLPISPLFIFLVGAVISYSFMFFCYKQYRLRFNFPKRYSGLRHIFFEKIWSRELIVILIGILAGLGFYFSNLTGRNDSFGITVPLFSLFNLIINGKGSLNWGIMFVFGTILGVFFTSIMSGEFAIIAPDGKTLYKTIMGSILMGIGATWAGGCLISNGLVGTAQASVRSYIALLFITLGIWTATRIFLVER